MLKNKNNIIKIIIMMSVALLILIPLTGCIGSQIPGITPTANSESASQILENTISVSGAGDIKIVPDQVVADIGIVTEKPTTQDAVNTNSTISNKVIDAIKKINAANMTIQTVGYNLTPLYDYSNQNQPPKLYAYQVASTVRVKTTDIGKIGEIIATATQSGATNISSVGFDLTDSTRKKAVNDALAIATKDATDKANAIAQSMGLKIDKISYVTESGVSVPGPIISLQAESAAKAGAVNPPPILPTEVEVMANITVVFMFTK
ncbi:MAG: SIMPL domain-containing protein [Actinobacteria bacterium]|nr:SIMPL domain-containing protein [Actinomycetota bacterium]